MKRKHIVHKRRFNQKFNKNLILSIIVILLIIAGSRYFIFKDEVAATVNGEKIYEKRVDAIYNSLQSDSKISKTIILQQIIDMKILAKYVEDQGYGLSDATFESELKKLLRDQNESMSNFKKTIALWGVSMDDYRESMEISIFVKGVLEGKADAVASILANERKTADVIIYSKYE